jgi:ATP-dependent DNA helicase DinG
MEIEQTVKKYLGDNFEFRKHQKEVVVKIWEHYLKFPNGTVVLDSATGSGKSWIAYALSALMREERNTGYIITSDLALHQQYENDIFKLRLNYGSVKGVDNYDCSVNGLYFSLGECKVKGLSYQKIKSLACYESCGYYSARNRAMNSSVAVLTYAYWLIQMNYVMEKMDDPPFLPREFTIFDECHKVPDIVQNHFSPLIAEKDFEKLERLERFLDDRRIFEFTVNPKKFIALYEKMRQETSLEILNQYLNEYERLLLPILRWGGEYKESIKETFKNEDLPKEIYGIFRILDWVKDLHCKVQDFNIIHKDRVDGIVKVVEEKALKFYTLYETDLIRKHLLKKSGFKVLMSATIGDPLKYLKIIGASETLFLSVPSTFNYSISPINVFTKYRMSFKEKEYSYPKVLELMDRILEIHKNDKGIIHCVEENSTVLMADNQVKRINTININDEIKTYNENLHLFENKKVLNVIDQGIKECIELTFDNSKSITCTKDHKILTKNRGWIEAQYIDQNDHVLEWENN